MRDYSMVSPQFWTGDTGRALRGAPDAQRLALYLLTCPSANMIGMYYLPMPLIEHEVGMTTKGATEALRRVCELKFAVYDDDSECVWVPEMARFQIGNQLKAGDKRLRGIERQLEIHRNCRFISDFLHKYRAFYGLTIKAPSRSPSEAPSKPGTRTGSRSGAG